MYSIDVQYQISTITGALSKKACRLDSQVILSSVPPLSWVITLKMGHYCYYYFWVFQVGFLKVKLGRVGQIIVPPLEATDH